VYCKNCCKEYNEKMKFCVICGEPLVASSAVSELAETPETPVTPPVTPPEPAVTPPETPVTPPEPAVTPPEPAVTPPETPVTPPEPTVSPQTEPTPPEPIYTPISEEEKAEDVEKTAEAQTQTESETDLGETQIIEQKKKIKVKIFRNLPAAVASIVLGVLVFALIMTAGITAAVRYATYPESVKGMVEGIDILSLPPPAELDGIVDTNVRDLGDAVYVYAEESGFTRDDIVYIYENATFKDGLVTVLSGYADYLRDGVVPSDLTTDDIKKLFDENIAVLSESIGDEVPLSEIQNAYESIDLAADYLSMLNLHNLSAQGAQMVNIARSLISYPAYVAMGAVLLLIIMLIARINKKAAPALIITGIAGISAAVLAALSALLVSNELLGIPELYKAIAGGAVSYLSMPIYITAAAIIFTGIILIIIGRVTARKAS
jgi:hypothetical protein